MNSPTRATFEQVFPSLAGIVDDVLPSMARDLPFHPLMFLQELILGSEKRQGQARHAAGVAALEAASIELLRDIRAARVSYPQGSLVLDWARLAVATSVAVAAFETGDLARTHEWLLRAVLVEEYRGDGDYTTDYTCLNGALSSPEQLVGALVTDAVLLWLTTLFSHGWRSGDLIDHAKNVFHVLPKMLSAGILLRASSPALVLDALIMRAQWATRHQPQDATSAAAPLLELLGSPLRIGTDRARIELFLATNTHPFAAEGQAERASRALTSYHTTYDAAERLQLRIASCAGAPTRLREIHGQLLEDLAAVRAERGRQAATPTESLLRAGQSFRLLQPVLRAYAEAGEIASAVEVLAAWSGNPSASRLVQSPLLAVPTHPVGTLWSAGGVMAPRDARPKETLGAFLDALNAFLDVTVINGDQPSPLRPPQREALFPHPKQGSRFEAESGRLLRLDALAELDKPLPNTLVLAPALVVPVQPILLRDVGHKAALSVSLRESSPARRLRRVALLGENTMTSGLELDGVASVLERAGVVVDRLPATASDFTSAYSGLGYDAIWIAAHGEYDSFQLERSALVLDRDEELSLDELAALPLPRGDRRLLVLNICSGAHSATFGGPLGVGLAQVLAGPSQSVISHLWPVRSEFAGAFGVMLSDSLVRLPDHLDAYADTMQAVLGGRESMLQRLSSMPGGRSVAERLHEGVEVENIVNWGAPTLLI